MLLYEIPMQAIPAQVLKATIALQNFTIELNQKGENLYFTLSIDNATVVSYVICRDAVSLVPENVIIGQFAFVDTKGNSDPYYSELGSRYKLAWYDING